MLGDHLSRRRRPAGFPSGRRNPALSGKELATLYLGLFHTVKAGYYLAVGEDLNLHPSAGPLLDRAGGPGQIQMGLLGQSEDQALEEADPAWPGASIPPSNFFRRFERRSIL